MFCTINWGKKIGLYCANKVHVTYQHDQGILLQFPATWNRCNAPCWQWRRCPWNVFSRKQWELCNMLSPYPLALHISHTPFLATVLHIRGEHPYKETHANQKRKEIKDYPTESINKSSSCMVICIWQEMLTVTGPKDKCWH